MNEILLGMILAVVTIVVGVCLPTEQMYLMFGILLGFASGVYIGFAVADPREKEVYLQWGVSIVFLALAVIGVWLSPIILGIAWILHGVWDLLHHFRIMKTKIADWYAPLCLIYDLVIGGFIITWAAI